MKTQGYQVVGVSYRGKKNMNYKNQCENCKYARYDTYREGIYISCYQTMECTALDEISEEEYEGEAECHMWKQKKVGVGE